MKPFNLTQYITQLPPETQQSILSDLTKLNLTPEDIDNAMNSRLCDLSDTIDISKYIKK